MSAQILQFPVPRKEPGISTFKTISSKDLVPISKARPLNAAELKMFLQELAKMRWEN